ncbi:MAG: TIR domain-containing protein [Bacteroidota bacterium]
MKTHVKIFIASAQADRVHLADFIKHLQALVYDRPVEIWHEGRLSPGTVAKQEIKSQMDAADFVVYLVSADFLASEYMREELLDMARMLHAMPGHTARFIPLIIRQCNWEYMAFLKDLQPLLPGKGPILSGDWNSLDEAWHAAVVKLSEEVCPLLNARIKAAEEVREATKPTAEAPKTAEKASEKPESVAPTQKSKKSATPEPSPVAEPIPETAGVETVLAAQHAEEANSNFATVLFWVIGLIFLIYVIDEMMLGF